MRLIFIIALLFPSMILAQGSEAEHPFEANKSKIPKHIKHKMEKYTWHPGCPVSLRDLRYIRINYWGFDHKSHLGFIIVNKSLAKEVTQIFKTLYEHKFPIEHMQLIDNFKGNDDASMSANNTSAFNCRDLTGKPGLFSQHSYGRAIDINPLINPYRSKEKTLPSKGVKFINRDKAYPGKITKKSFIYKLFTQYGWDWGGDWYDVQDFQHFEKRAHCEKRNPLGSSLKVIHKDHCK